MIFINEGIDEALEILSLEECEVRSTGRVFGKDT